MKLIKILFVIALLAVLFTLFNNRNSDQLNEPPLSDNNEIPSDTNGGASTPSTLRAAIARVAETSPLCSGLGDFYWAVGNKNGVIVDGYTGTGSVRKDTELDIASASKFIYAAYVLEKNKGLLSEDTVSKLNFTSGYVKGHLCFPADTPAQCFARSNNNVKDETQVGKFYYGPGHFLALAAEDPDIQGARGAEIGRSVSDVLGITISFNNPKLAGAGIATPAAYSAFLTKLTNGDYYLSRQLGARAVCASVVDCPVTASQTPIPAEFSWDYSFGHWVETDPRGGAGAFSSPGVFGFYPWVTSSKNYWGLLAREDKNILVAAPESVYCGRELRAAFLNAI